MDKVIPINRQILRILCKARGKDYSKLAGELGVTLTDVENWIEGKEEPKQFDYDNLCDVLKVEPSFLLLSSAETITEAQHLLVLEFYVNQKLGLNDAPRITDARSVLTDIQSAAEVADAEEEVKQADITIFSPPETNSDREPNNVGSDDRKAS